MVERLLRSDAMDIAQTSTAPHCCDSMRAYVEHEDGIIYWWPKFHEYLISVHDGGSSGILIRFCPWCGTQLPESSRDAFFDACESSINELEETEANQEAS